jgi:hypothetical protein
VALKKTVCFTHESRARASEYAKAEYGTDAYLDSVDVCLGATTVARFYQDSDTGGLVLVPADKFREVEQSAIA